MRRFATSLAFLALLAPGALVAKDAPAPKAAAASAAAAPRLVVAISVDQFSADLFAQYRQHFSQGLGRLLQGAVFPSGFQSHAATETCPGHSTIMTGARPARTGIIANNWFDLSLGRAEKQVYCMEDTGNKASTPDDPVVTADNLKVPTLGDRLKQANRASRNVAVSAKDRSAVLMGGHNIDQVYWWKDGAFVTLPKRRVGSVAEGASVVADAIIARGMAELAVPEWCADRNRAIPVGEGSVGMGRFAVRPGNQGDFRASPHMDQAVLGLADRLVDSMRLGRGKATDVLSVSLSATDYIGHGNGSEGAEMCIQMAELDRALGEFFTRLDDQGIDYLVVLTADHGGFDMPERQEQQANPAAKRVDDTLDLKGLAFAISQQTGISAPEGQLLYADGVAGDYYVSKALSEVDRPRVISALVEMVRANPQVAQAYTAAELAETPMPTGSPQDWTLRERARASFYPGRSGDVLVMLKRGVVPIAKGRPGYVATHGSPWDYDRRVPILFWRKGVPGLEQPAPVETVDIAPTLAAAIGLAVPAGEFDGRCLDIDGSARDICR